MQLLLGEKWEGADFDLFFPIDTAKPERQRMTLELSLDPDEPKDFVYPMRKGGEKMQSHDLKEFYAFAADYLNSPDKRNTIAYRRNAIAQTTTVRIDKLNLIGIVKSDDCTAPMKAVDEFSPKYIDLWKWIQVEFDLECCKVAYDFHQNKLMISSKGTKGTIIVNRSMIFAIGWEVLMSRHFTIPPLEPGQLAEVRTDFDLSQKNADRLTNTERLLMRIEKYRSRGFKIDIPPMPIVTTTTQNSVWFVRSRDELDYLYSLISTRNLSSHEENVRKFIANRDRRQPPPTPAQPAAAAAAPRHFYGVGYIDATIRN